MSGDRLRAMMERAGSACTVVWNGGRGSSRLPQPSSVASFTTASKRPAPLETAPRPTLAPLRVSLLMASHGTVYPISLLGDRLRLDYCRTGSPNLSIRHNVGNRRIHTPVTTSVR